MKMKKSRMKKRLLALMSVMVISCSMIGGAYAQDGGGGRPDKQNSISPVTVSTESVDTNSQDAE